MNSDDQAQQPVEYTTIFGILMAALIVSLIIGHFSQSPWAVGVIFLIAAVKAWLVVAHFMHLTIEPRFIKVLVLCLVVVLAILFIGLAPDIIGTWAKPGSGV